MLTTHPYQEMNNMDENCQDIAWIVLGVFCGTWASSWIYALIIGILGILFIIYMEFVILGGHEQ